MKDEKMNHRCFTALDALFDFCKEFSEVVNIGAMAVNLNGEKMAGEFNPAFLFEVAYVSKELFEPRKVIALINRAVKQGFTLYKGLTIVPFPISVEHSLQGFILLIDKADVDHDSLLYANNFFVHASFPSSQAEWSQPLHEKSKQKILKRSHLFLKMATLLLSDNDKECQQKIHSIQHLREFEKNKRGKSEILKAIQFIQANLDSPLSLKEVADQVYFSQSYFGKLFKKELGMNFVEYLNLQRVNAATSLLEKTDLKIEEISKKVGFSQTSYFCKIFKEIRKTSPVAYRKQFRREYIIL